MLARPYTSLPARADCAAKLVWRKNAAQADEEPKETKLMCAECGNHVMLKPRKNVSAYDSYLVSVRRLFGEQR